MWIILGLLISLSALALEPFEKISNVKMLRILPDNIVMINRGIEDGIMKNDHIRISNEMDGFGGRGICVKANATNSYWRLYRVPNASAFSLDFTYTIQGLADREIPFPEAEIRDKDYKITEKEKKEGDTPDPFKIKKDLPEKLTERDLIGALGPDQKKLAIEEAINKERFSRDFKEFKLSLYASPFVRQSINEGENYRYGFRAGNIGSKYRLMTQMDQQQSRIKDPLNKHTVSTRSTMGQVQFSINRIKKNISTLSFINYDSYRFSRLATPRHHWQIAPIGLTWHIYESKNWEYLDLSYAPMVDARETDVIDTKNSKTTSENKTGIRHGFRLALKNKINERVAVENLLWYRPFQEPSTWAIDGGNMNLLMDFKLIISLTQNLYFDYNLIYMRDVLWKKLNNLSENNTINSLNIRYDLEFL